MQDLKLLLPCRVSQLNEIMIDNLLVLAKVTPKQCPGAILISK